MQSLCRPAKKIRGRQYEDARKNEGDEERRSLICCQDTRVNENLFQAFKCVEADDSCILVVKDQEPQSTGDWMKPLLNGRFCLL